MILKKNYLLIFFIIALFGCNAINPKEDIPTFIYIDSVRVISTAPAIHGTVSQNIKDVWVYYERELLGAFPLPAKVPVLANQKGQLQVVAGIWEDGLSGLRAKYPFYTVDTFSFNANPTNTIHHVPHFYYRTADTERTVYYNEDFEQGNGFEAAFGDTSFVKTNAPEDVYEGSWASKLVLSDSNKYGESKTVQTFSFPSNRMCYIELNYKNDIPFVLRVSISQGGAQTNVDLTGFNTSEKWNKFYFNFGVIAAAYPSATFKFILSASLPTGTSKGNVHVDNFKIINFKE